MSRLERIALGDDTGKYKGPPRKAGEKKYPGIPGVGNTLNIAGQSFLLNANGSNFGSCFVVLEPFSKRHGDEEYDESIAQKLRKIVAEEIDDAVVSIFRAPAIQGLGSAGGFKLQTQQRGFVDLQELQTVTDDLVAEGNKDPRLLGLFSMYRANTPQLYIDID